MSDLSRVFNAAAKGDVNEVKKAVSDMGKKYGPAALGVGLAGPLGLILANQVKHPPGFIGKMFGRPKHIAVAQGGPDFSVLDTGCVNPMTGRSSEPVSLNAVYTLAAATAIAADTAVAANDAFRTAASAFLSSNNIIPGGFHAFEVQTMVSLTNVASRVETPAHVNALYFVELVNGQEVARPAIGKMAMTITDGGIVTSGGAAATLDVKPPTAFNRRYLTDIPYSLGLRSPIGFTPTAAIVINQNFFGYRSRGAQAITVG